MEFWRCNQCLLWCKKWKPCRQLSVFAGSSELFARINGFYFDPEVSSVPNHSSAKKWRLAMKLGFATLKFCCCCCFYNDGTAPEVAVIPGKWDGNICDFISTTFLKNGWLSQTFLLQHGSLKGFRFRQVQMVPRIRSKANPFYSISLVFKFNVGAELLAIKFKEKKFTLCNMAWQRYAITSRSLCKWEMHDIVKSFFF